MLGENTSLLFFWKKANRNLLSTRKSEKEEWNAQAIHA